jgi:hypothetical protein
MGRLSQPLVDLMGTHLHAYGHYPSAKKSFWRHTQPLGNCSNIDTNIEARMVAVVVYQPPASNIFSHTQSASDTNHQSTIFFSPNKSTSVTSQANNL